MIIALKNAAGLGLLGLLAGACTVATDQEPRGARIDSLPLGIAAYGETNAESGGSSSVLNASDSTSAGTGESGAGAVVGAQARFEEEEDPFAEVLLAATAKAKSCCVCQYWDVKNPTCAASNKDEKTCIGVKDCVWHADTKTCTNSSEDECDVWLKKQSDAGQCDAQAKGAIPNQGDYGDPTLGLKDCTKFAYHYAGHSNANRCNSYFALAKVCVAQYPECSDFSFSNDGCSSFGDKTNARTQAEALQKQMGGAKCITISANQCTASASCSSQWTFTLTPTGATGCPSSPCNDGGLCWGHDEVATCVTASGKGWASQRCCCEGANNTQCKWNLNKFSCPPMPEGALDPKKKKG